VLVTLARSKATSSGSARLVPWTTLPSMQRRNSVGVDDQPAIVCDGEFARPYLAGAAVGLDLGDDRDHRPRPLGAGDAAPGQGVVAVGTRRGARLPPGALGRRVDDGDVARRLQIAQAEGDRVGADRSGDLVDEGFAGGLDLRAHRVAPRQLSPTAERRSPGAWSSSRLTRCWSEGDSNRRSLSQTSRSVPFRFAAAG
jgi:hypothetical protein